MNAIVIDDEKNQRSVVRQLLEKYCPTVNILGEAEAAAPAFKLISELKPDLIFLDIEMPHGSGFELLKMFDKIDFEVVFITGFGHYAVKAFEFNALHFIHKPIDDLKLIRAVAKAHQRMQERERAEHNRILLENLKRTANNPDNQITIPVFEGFEFVRVKNIIRCEGDEGNTAIYLQDRKRIFSSKHLKKYEDVLEDYNFCRVHNSHIINILHVKQFLKHDGGLIVMSDGSKIPVSRRKKDKFIELLRKKGML